MRVPLLALALLVATAPAGSAGSTGPQITDPPGDGNFVNDQGNSSVYDFDNNALNPDLSDDGDILAVAFSNDDRKVSVHVQVEHDPTATANAHTGPGLMFAIVASPAAGDPPEDGCLRWNVTFQGNPATSVGASSATFRDRCAAGGAAAEAEHAVRELPDGTAVISITAPRRASGLLGRGATLSRPWAASHVVAGVDPSSPAWFDRLLVDTTVVGESYRLR